MAYVMHLARSAAATRQNHFWPYPYLQLISSARSASTILQDELFAPRDPPPNNHNIVAIYSRETSSTMKLTNVLRKFHPMFLGPVPKYPGQAKAGKDRYVEPATKSVRYNLWKEWRDQEEVLKNISTPFITAEQEAMYLHTTGYKHHDVDPLYTSRIEKPMRQRYAIEIVEKFERSRQFEILE